MNEIDRVLHNDKTYQKHKAILPKEPVLHVQIFLHLRLMKQYAQFVRVQKVEVREGCAQFFL